ncbi:MAG: glycosyltransferase family 9 protein [Candidatus Omnitrophica bacterium]|nr:glycosyltransferase family 9 protein [Candidatus Omnitrophota bacterium]
MRSDPIGIFDILNSIGGWRLKAVKIFDLAIGSCLARILPGKPPGEVLAKSIGRILVIRPGGIGDAIFVLPFLRAIKKENPGMIIDILCEKRNERIFSGQKEVCDGVFCYDRLRSFREIWKRGYDMVVDTEQWHYLSALVSYFINSKINTGFATRPLRAKLFNKAIAYLDDAYETENFKNLFLPLGRAVSRINDIGSSFFVDEEAMKWAQENAPGQYVTLFLGASIPLRRLSLNQSAEIIHFAFSKSLSVVLLGGPDVVREAREIVENVADRRVADFVGKASLMQTAALIKRSGLFIGPDSGIMHLARAVGTPVIAVLGPGNLKKWFPKESKDKMITLNVECSPCTRFGYTVPTCRGGYKCMKDIRLDSPDEWYELFKRGDG